jgi:hypothetical protein
MALEFPRHAAADDGPATEYFKIVVPFLKEHCIHCHGGEEPEGEFSLERFRESANVREEYDVWQKVLAMVGEREMPPMDEPQPTPDEISIVIRVIESEIAKFDCQSETRRPGRVTIRRLNRVEYNNTIRDLVGIDFQPADDFPSDDVGHPIDSTGTVREVHGGGRAGGRASAEGRIGPPANSPDRVGGRQRLSR